MQERPTYPQSFKLVTAAMILSSMPVAGCVVCESVGSHSDEASAFIFWIFCVACAVVGLICGLIQIARGVHKRLGLLAIAIAVGTTISSFFIGLQSSGGITSGRPLRRRGRALAPDSAEDDGWLTEMNPIDAPIEAAEGWRRNAALETASIAAFSHLANELLAIGAPARLISNTQSDAADEVRHAQLCYGIAAAIDGKTLGPAPFPEAMAQRSSAPTVESVAADCVVEACLYECAAAKLAHALSLRRDVPEQILLVLQIIAVDEARHAEHGYDIVRYCVARAGISAFEAMDLALQRDLARHRRGQAEQSALDAQLALERDLAGQPGEERTASAFDAQRDQTRHPSEEVNPLETAVSTVSGAGLERFGLGSDDLWRRCVAEARGEVSSQLDSLRRALLTDRRADGFRSSLSV